MWIHRSYSPLILPALWTDVAGARDPDPATHDEWLNFTKGQGSNCMPCAILACLTQMHEVSSHVSGLEGDCKPFDTPNTSLRSRSPSNHEPWTFSCQIPTSNDLIPEELHTLFHSPSLTIPFYQPAPRDPPKPVTCGGKYIAQEEVQIMSQLVGHGVNAPWPCNSWSTAVPFYYLLNTMPTHLVYLVSTLLNKGSTEHTLNH